MKGRANRVTEWVVSFPKTTILLIVLLTIFFVSNLPKLRMETDIESMLPKEMPAYVNKNKLEEIFGVKDMMVIGIVNEGPDGIFNRESLALIKEITDQLRLMDGINSRGKNDLISLATLDNIIGTEEGMEVIPDTRDLIALVVTIGFLVLLKANLYPQAKLDRY